MHRVSFSVVAAVALAVPGTAAAQNPGANPDLLTIGLSYRQQVLSQVLNPYTISPYTLGLNQQQAMYFQFASRNFLGPYDARGDYLRILGYNQLYNSGPSLPVYQMQLAYMRGTLPNNQAINNYLRFLTYQQTITNYARVFQPAYSSIYASAPAGPSIYMNQMLARPRVGYSSPGAFSAYGGREDYFRNLAYQQQSAIQYQQRAAAYQQMLQPSYNSMLYQMPLRYMQSNAYTYRYAPSRGYYTAGDSYEDTAPKYIREPLADLFRESPGERELELAMLFLATDPDKARTLLERALAQAVPDSEVAASAKKGLELVPKKAEKEEAPPAP